MLSFDPTKRYPRYSFLEHVQELRGISAYSIVNAVKCALYLRLPSFSSMVVKELPSSSA